ncbi:MAG: hypothetical protein H0T42_29875 [Deltaproteobacteria bacterium]|nr:hypothetical protein [Deltaproteobacteria bacterium]
MLAGELEISRICSAVPMHRSLQSLATMARNVHTRWLDADAYASIVVTEEIEDASVVIPLDLNQRRALELLSKAIRGLALLRVA